MLLVSWMVPRMNVPRLQPIPGPLAKAGRAARVNSVNTSTHAHYHASLRNPSCGLGLLGLLGLDNDICLPNLHKSHARSVIEPK